MERNLWIAKKLEQIFSSWADDNVKAKFKSIEPLVTQFFNPELKNTRSPTEDYIMADLLPAFSLAVFYLFSIFMLKFVIQFFSPSVSTQRKGTVSLSEKFRREPLLLLALAYNFTQVIVCSYMVYRILQAINNLNYSFACNPYNFQSEEIAKCVWLFYMSKVLDMFDTYLIVLRKKWRQLSFLHLYHHTSVFVMHWFAVRASYDSDIYFVVLANSTVHVVMYFYYMLRILGIHVPAFIKQGITYFQIIQFTLMIIQAIFVLLNDCEFPNRLLWLYMAYVASLLILFVNFFLQTYVNKKTAKKKTA